ncbi:hypothetical protein [Pseudomonas multiresinivorans]|uniref:Uncharacterized protein n=1 Tax=Pseudomonas multiresinivorans TaxID=95301 RepID=A0A7Z3GPS1_9PSED|nr:hypothetical protein [Pseudomonas multiresinivorans]QJP08370.1 hypothetical protein G4G71_10970 [Pseudomonas multiresinivorans]QJP10486.1 hypothetical protein G4G71_22310 [Pseudomonas multiresinivorans]
MDETEVIRSEFESVEKKVFPLARLSTGKYLDEDTQKRWELFQFAWHRALQFAAIPD